MGFIDYCISKGYKPYRVQLERKGKKLVKEYQDSSDDLAFFSTMAPGHFDLRLIKDGNEIIWGLGTNQDGSIHPPTLSWPIEPFGRCVTDVDRAFKVMTNEEILYKIEHWFDLEKISKLKDGE